MYMHLAVDFMVQALVAFCDTVPSVHLKQRRKDSPHASASKTPPMRAHPMGRGSTLAQILYVKYCLTSNLAVANFVPQRRFMRPREQVPSPVARVNEGLGICPPQLSPAFDWLFQTSLLEFSTVAAGRKPSGKRSLGIQTGDENSGG